MEESNTTKTIKVIPENDEDLANTLFGGIFDGEQPVVATRSYYSDLKNRKIIYAIKNGESKWFTIVAPMIAKSKTDDYWTRKNKILICDGGFQSNVSTVGVDMLGKYPTYTVYQKLVSSYLSEYIEKVTFFKATIQTFSVQLEMKFPCFSHTTSSFTYPRYVLDYEPSYNESISNIFKEKLDILNDFKTDVSGLTKSAIKEFYSDLLKAGLGSKVFISGADSFEELVAPNKKGDLNVKLMSLKKRGREIFYNKVKKSFTVRVKKEDNSTNNFDDDACLEIIKSAKITISQNQDRYSDQNGFSYTLLLISKDATEEEIAHPYSYINNNSGMNEFYCIEDENIFDIIKKLRELNIPTCISGIGRLLTTYRRVGKLVEIINENFPEDVLLSEISDEDIAL